MKQSKHAYNTNGEESYQSFCMKLNLCVRYGLLKKKENLLQILDGVPSDDIHEFVD